MISYYHELPPLTIPKKGGISENEFELYTDEGESPPLLLMYWLKSKINRKAWMQNG